MKYYSEFPGGKLDDTRLPSPLIRRIVMKGDPDCDSANTGLGADADCFLVFSYAEVA